MNHLISLKKYPLLSDKEERELTLKYFESRDDLLRNKLIQHNMRLVIKAAHQYCYKYTNISDVIQEGYIGLLKGIEAYDPHRGVKLSDYAYHWIKAYIMKFIINNAHLVKIGTTKAQKKLFFSLTKTKTKYMSNGVEPTPEMLAKHLGVKVKEVVDMEQRMSGTLSIDNDNSISFAENKSNTDELLQLEEQKSIINNIMPLYLNKLSERNRDIFKRRIMAEDPETLEEIGNSYGLTRERIRQVESDLKISFKKFLKNNFNEL